MRHPLELGQRRGAGQEDLGHLERLVDGVRGWWSNSRLAQRLAKASGCNSVVPSTLVLLADGTTKPIEELEVGDVVFATDPETDQTEAETVAATIIGHGAKDLVEITIDTAGDAGMIIGTDGHPFWVPDLYQWVDATDL